MDVRELVNIVRQSETDGTDYYQLAAKIAAAQKEADAALAESLGATSVANAIRLSS